MDEDMLMRTLQKKKRGLNTMLISFLLGAALLLVQAWLSPTLQPENQQEEVGALSRVVRIVDGDTVVIDRNNASETLRLIGVDTPELHHPTKPVQCFAREAAAYITSLLKDRSVRVVSDPSQDARDKYGRTLAYLYRDDGLFINKALIEEGYGYEYTYEVPYVYQKEFKAAQTDAREQQKGLWAPNTCNGKTDLTLP
jgi:micrococcal nuclease